MMKLVPSEASDIYSKSMAEFLRGTGIEILVSERKDCPTQAEYINFIILKNFGYFELLCRL
jgi:hypothetical protein